jgi:hypothetical protein
VTSESATERTKLAVIAASTTGFGTCVAAGAVQTFIAMLRSCHDALRALVQAKNKDGNRLVPFPVNLILLLIAFILNLILNWFSEITSWAIVIAGTFGRSWVRHHRTYMLYCMCFFLVFLFLNLLLFDQSSP